MDLGLKPSLAAYAMRVDEFDPRRPSTSSASPQQQAAKDKDEALLALVDRQVQIAAGKLKSGDKKQAMAILKRCYDLANSHQAPSPNGERPLVKRFAISIVRLQTCAALSQLGRHDQALEEATAAKQDLDELWLVMTGATVELEAAQAVGDTSMPHPVLRHHILHPPSWLSRALEATIQARLCLAVEMEYILPIEVFEAALEAASNAESREAMGLPALRSGGAARKGSSGSRPTSRKGTRSGVPVAPAEGEEEIPQIGQPIPALSRGQELYGLYQEANRLASKLLPKNNVVRKDAERTEKEARQRWKEFTGVPSSPTSYEGYSRPETASDSRPTTRGFAEPSPESSRPGTAAMESFPIQPMGELRTLDRPMSGTSEVLPELDSEHVSGQSLSLSRMQKTSRMKSYEMGSISPLRPGSRERPRSRPQSVGGSTDAPDEFGDGTLTPWMLASTDSFGSFGSVATTHSEWVRTSPPGDVFYRSQPANFAAMGGGSISDVSTRKSKKKKKRSSSPDSTPQPQASEERDPDPFKDWTKNYMDVGNMSLFQRKLLTLEGMGSLQHDMKTESRRFKHFMQDLENCERFDEMRLTDDRIVYTDHGMHAIQLGQQKMQALRKKAWKQSQFGQKLADQERELFDYYEVSPPAAGKEMNVKHLRKLMKESFDRTPGEVARKKEEEEQMMRLKKEEEAKKKAHLAAAFGLKKEEKPEVATRKRGSVARGSIMMKGGNKRGSVSAPNLIPEPKSSKDRPGSKEKV
mmetsp:Transcript_25380/g.46014  ORF Transcript_25380/g.46014 Transcript_25380/m.46014 type:complete len:752 (+) Transcript_25380:90-2345(+)|eukprot:CAMPEP_0197628604 /NCGR_PEP_ID=MMETSP1338-20131121/6838_1 /TAXON_ID=43686 ORGANISM="Pelagodinium beii, Strain RCC1491" /NCGR_SAMPLE_ID=MMETSP1338 /ASSEMBLY_ACC=CAM_ASM_000754 /LENGTH=751 /DNA_ID=CAMNT_0043199589 /DNA_START=90 /DNA_END=2345 /DNA_ORIENTATION=+